METPVISITFNIVYVRDTLDLLLPFFCTLLSHSACNYRLIANGCTPSEVERLQHFCQRYPRTTFYLLSEGRIVPHGEAINRLLKLEDSPYFAFMDSDIFATGSWLEPHLQALQQSSVIFAGLPIWQELNTSVWQAPDPMMAGRLTMTERGLCLGVSYYAIYPRDMLQECMERYSVGFQRCDWSDIALPIRQMLERRGLRAQTYDTGKLLNILLQQEGVSMQYLTTPALVHLGAASEPAREAQERREHGAGIDLSRLRRIARSFKRRLKRGVYTLLGRTLDERASDLRAAANSILIYIKDQRSLPSTEVWLRELTPEMQSRFETVGSHLLDIYNTFSLRAGDPCSCEERGGTSSAR